MPEIDARAAAARRARLAPLAFRIRVAGGLHGPPREPPTGHCRGDAAGSRALSAATVEPSRAQRGLPASAMPGAAARARPRCRRRAGRAARRGGRSGARAAVRHSAARERSLRLDALPIRAAGRVRRSTPQRTDHRQGCAEERRPRSRSPPRKTRSARVPDPCGGRPPRPAARAPDRPLPRRCRREPGPQRGGRGAEPSAARVAGERDAGRGGEGPAPVPPSRGARRSSRRPVGGSRRGPNPAARERSLRLDALPTGHHRAVGVARGRGPGAGPTNVQLRTRTRTREPEPENLRTREPPNLRTV